MANVPTAGAACAGVEIGGTKLQVVVGRPGDIQVRRRFPVAKAAGGEGIRAQLAAELPGLLAAHSVAAIGVGFGGPVDWRTGIIRCSHQIPGWADFPLGDWLRDLIRLPVRVDNDANTAALGEALHGAGQGLDPVFYVTLGSGVGGGLVVSGQIYHGAVPGEAEIGHLRLNREGVIVENRCSGWAVDAKIRTLKQTGLDGPLGQLLDERPATGGEPAAWPLRWRREMLKPGKLLKKPLVIWPLPFPTSPTSFIRKSLSLVADWLWLANRCAKLSCVICRNFS